MTARFRLALWALTLTLTLAAIAVQAKTPLVPRATCLSQCGGTITAQCTKTLKNGKTKIKKACKTKLIRQCRHNQPVCATTTTTTLPGGGGGARTLTLTVPPTGSDLDNGWTGTSHNFPIINGSSIQYTLTCNGSDCTGSGPTGAGTVNGATFGAPLPLLAANVPVCVVNRYQTSPLMGTFNLQTGDAGVSAPNMVPLFSDVYLRTTFSEVCPKCVIAGGGGDLGSTGTCSSTAKNPGASCKVNGKVTVAGKGLYLLSTDCNVVGDSAPTTLNIQLPLTTGQAPPLVGPTPCPDSAGPQTSDDSCNGSACNARCSGAACTSTDAAGNCIDAKGGISQLCCASNPTIPCFPTSAASKAAGGGSIIRTGKPVVPGDQAGGVFAGTFCIARTDSSLINITTGLPGPGALLLPSVGTLSGQ